MHRRALVLAGFAVSTAAAALAACSGGSPATSGCTAPTVPPNVLPQLVYPAPKASGVPDALSVLVYAATSQQTIELLSGGTPVTTTATSVPSPLPTPNASASPGLSLFAVSVPSLAVSSPYTVTVAITETTGCGQTVRQVPFAAFFTQ